MTPVHLRQGLMYERGRRGERNIGGSMKADTSHIEELSMIGEVPSPEAHSLINEHDCITSWKCVNCPPSNQTGSGRFEGASKIPRTQMTGFETQVWISFVGGGLSSVTFRM
ncbi:hypothetical protein chiPu_0006598 [Chiloscyllium punctatum]|uniref:Uncharacterized protein n=1 Tax=Chiloscyllium punctatum TaxID=137246 RepID=A0A401SCT6_CHIPU|nr:hypothetical protein [Chiloscyllium punctatum]